MTLTPSGATLGWLLWPSRSDLFDLTGIILPSGTVSYMIDCPPPPRPALGIGGGGSRARLWGGTSPPRHDSGYPQFLNTHLILRCKYETRIPSMKLCSMYNLISDNYSGNISPPRPLCLYISYIWSCRL